MTGTPIHGGMPCDPLTTEETTITSGEHWPSCNDRCDPEAGWHYLVGEAPARRRSGLIAAVALLLALALVAVPVALAVRHG